MSPSAPPPSSRDQILDLLRAGARTAGELAAAIGISPQAVRDQLRTLEGRGWVDVGSLRRDTGGKPAREYVLTAAGEESFEKPYLELLRYLVDELEEQLGGRRKRELYEAVGRRIGADLGAGGRTEAEVPDARGPDAARERLEAAVRVLDGLGGAAAVEETADGFVIRSDGCPLSGLVQRDPEACLVAEALVEATSGVPVRETCDRSGRARCRFGTRAGGADGAG